MSKFELTGETVGTPTPGVGTPGTPCTPMLVRSIIIVLVIPRPPSWSKSPRLLSRATPGPLVHPAGHQDTGGIIGKLLYRLQRFCAPAAEKNASPRGPLPGGKPGARR